MVLVQREVMLLSNKSNSPDSMVHGANMGPIWGRQDPGGPHVGPMNFAIWEEELQAHIKQMASVICKHTI